MTQRYSNYIIVLSIIPFIISVMVLIFEGWGSLQAIYWFIIGVVFIYFPYVSEIKFKDMEMKLNAAVEEIIQRRFANLIFLVAKDTKRTALGLHRFHKKYLPPGRRLRNYEMPHEPIFEIVRDQFGIEVKRENFFPVVNFETYPVINKKGESIGKTEVCIRPYRVQREIHEQRGGIPEHYDFVYVCVVEEECNLSGTRKGKWFTLREVVEMANAQNSAKEKTFKDVADTLVKIFEDLEKETIIYT